MLDVPALEPLTNTTPFLGRAWHAVAPARALNDAPLGVWLLGEPWVVVRLENRLVAFEDRCPHRLAPLSAGRVCGNELQCAYHGWRFDRHGHCRAIPAIVDSAHIPKRATLRQAWGVQEHCGLIWLAPQEPLCPPHPFPEWDTPGFEQIWTTTVTTAVSAGQLVDNFLDAAHFPFVHQATFGDEKAATVLDDGIVREGWTVRTEFATWYRNFDDPLVETGVHDVLQPQDLLKQGSASLTVYLRLKFPVTGATMAILFCCTPETADRTCIYKLVARDDLAGDLHRAARTVADEDTILAEDLAVLERYRAMELHLDPTVELHTRADRLSLAWRRLLAEWAGGAPSNETPGAVGALPAT
jgi:vanillate O-demethylase monooxygenase subunit